MECISGQIFQMMLTIAFVPKRGLGLDEMEKVGLDVPETVKLTADLNRNGFSMPEGLLHTEECADAIATAIRGRRSTCQS